MKQIIKVSKKGPKFPKFKVTEVPDIDTTVEDELKSDIRRVVGKYSQGFKENYKEEIYQKQLFWMSILMGLMFLWTLSGFIWTTILITR